MPRKKVSDAPTIAAAANLAAVAVSPSGLVNGSAHAPEEAGAKPKITRAKRNAVAKQTMETTPAKAASPKKATPRATSVRKSRVSVSETSTASIAALSDVTQQGTLSEAEQINLRAYFRWLERGCPEGSPDQDWYSAERELRAQTT